LLLLFFSKKTILQQRGRRLLIPHTPDITITPHIETLEFKNWWGNTYALKGKPLVFIDQAYEGEKGEGSLIKEWVDEFGDQYFHHIAIRVEDIEHSVDYFKSKLYIEFSSAINGEPNDNLRQIFTKPEMQNGKAFSVLELIERNNGYMGLLPPTSR